MTYSTNADYADLTASLIPPTNGPNPIAPIDFSPEFIDVMSYFNSLFERSELSPRSLSITFDAIRLNPANYTAWHFRRRCLFHLGCDLKAELDSLRSFALSNSKNYQVWYHRQSLLEKLDNIDLSLQELSFLEELLQNDAKNYHVWTFRQWILTWLNSKQQPTWEAELTFIETLLNSDVFNYSAWSQRRFILSQSPIVSFEDDCSYSIEKIKSSLLNESAWMYLRGLGAERDYPPDVLCFITENSSSNRFAALVLAEVYERTGKLQEAQETFRVLSVIDPIRCEFWKAEADSINK
ncbi:hypothetical protein RCL1_001081 [Eukaryota sp. TZLM3-RCL]